MPIELDLSVAAIAGFLIGLIIRNPKLGCAALSIVPTAAIVYVLLWQGAHPENVRSTSGLDFVFAPIWPTLTALGGFLAAMALRYVGEVRNRS